MMRDGRHFRSSDTTAAVQGRKDFAECDHLSANAGFFFNQGYLIPLISQVKGRLHPGYTAANDKSIDLDFSQDFISSYLSIFLGNGLCFMIDGVI